MAFVAADTTQLGYIPEESWGVIPATPNWKLLRMTSESLQIDRSTVTSSEIRPDRNVADLITVGGGASGGFNFELSYGIFDDLIAAVLESEWNTDKVVNGAKQTSFALEKRLALGEDNYEYHRFTGMTPNTLSLNCEAQQIVTGSFGFMGKGGAVDSAIVSEAQYTDAPTDSIMNTSSHFANLTVTGAANPCIQSLSIEISNALRARNAVGSLDSIGIGGGRFSVTGSMNCYFESNSLYKKFLDDESVSLSFVVGTMASKKYKITMPRIKFSGGAPAAGGNDQDVMVNLSYQAIFDSVLGGTMSIERGVA
ncbi:phage tail tube protein [Pyramidobacter sp.]|uniref:phage tail tube protein n=1 Tax=Pyramidobacter sp. TaxID=1943581 RepID=UPI0025E39933|nr:phage tail tube protein [Pyramidobacter sp.]MCI7403750.1 phage tail tube protein [Pyramidobacter sp.]MDY3211371.1 phage tail tube protein [Pyramidobacter sp.]